MAKSDRSILRICRDCGLKASAEEDLNLFKYSKTSKHNRDNLCKKCFNARRRKRFQNNDRSYLLRIFRGMKRRCYDSKRIDYSRYGGRGIIICDEWLNDPELFVEWSLKKGWSRGLTIERINNDGPYSPKNCCWLSLEKQSKNQRKRYDAVTFDYTRICYKCGKEKALSDFHKDKRAPKGRRYICKDCRK